MIITYTMPKHPPIRFQTESNTVVIGRRPAPDQRVDIDLEPDDYVSKMHTCITRENDAYWIQDLGSMNGTWVNGAKIEEKKRLEPGESIQVGYTVIVVQMDVPSKHEAPPEGIDLEATAVSDESDAERPPRYIPPVFEEASEDIDLEATVVSEEAVGEEAAEDMPAPPESEVTKINPELSEPTGDEEVSLEEPTDDTMINPEFAEAEKVDITEVGFKAGLDALVEDEPVPEQKEVPGGEVISADDATIHTLIGSGKDTVDEVLTQGWRSLKAYNELVSELGTVDSLNALVEILIQHLQKAIPNALRGAVLLPDKKGDLLLKAHWPTGDQSVSMTWVNRAFQRGEAFIWTAPAEDALPKDLPKSAIYYKVKSAIYVPLLLGPSVLGVMYVDNYYDREAFSATDIELLKAVANQVAIFVRNHILRKDRQKEELLISRLSRQFSPKIFELMMKRDGRQRIGGERIDPVTILVSDVRGFTALSHDMAPDDVVRMLNEMFDAFVPIIFEHDGVVDKYVGDSVLAVFGSPEPDNQQCEKAIRAAMEMQQAVRMLDEGRRVRRLPEFKVGISIHTGAVIHGFIGSAERTEYTVIGDTVNLASRYCDGADPGEIIISKDVYERVYRLVDVHPKTIKTKHSDTEPDLEGYVVHGIKEA